MPFADFEKSKYDNFHGRCQEVGPTAVSTINIQKLEI